MSQCNFFCYCYLDTHTQRGGQGSCVPSRRGSWTCDPFPWAWGPGGCSITELIHSSLPGLAGALPAHPLPQLAHSTQHSLYSPAPYSSTTRAHALTKVLKMHLEDMIWSWKLATWKIKIYCETQEDIQINQGKCLCALLVFADEIKKMLAHFKQNKVNQSSSNGSLNNTRATFNWGIWEHQV